MSIALATGYAAAQVPDLGTRKAGDDWPTFLGPHHNSTSDEKGILTQWDAHPPRIIWERKLNTGYSMPTISRGRLFLFERIGDQLTLTCMTSEGGTDLWSYAYPTKYEDMYGYNNGPRCSPIVDDDRVYIYGPLGKLTCLNVVNGKVIWQVDTFEKFNVVPNFFGVGSTPVIEGDLLIAQVGGSPPDSEPIGSGHTKGLDSGIVAFNKHTGQVVYHITDELASYSSPVTATIDGRRWCFVFTRGGLVGFEPATGKVDFQYPWRARINESVNASTPIVVNDMVFISETYGPGASLLKVKPGGYDIVWRDGPNEREHMQAHWNTPIVREGYLYGCSGRHTGNAELRCLDFKTGEVKWSQPRLTRSSLLYVDDHFICLTEYGRLLLLRVNHEKFDMAGMLALGDDDGTEKLKYPAWAAPILSHGLLYVRGADRLLCMELIPVTQ
ncbi:MAG: PQQ-binding-like beta-propeller repeat protein [Planctomycetes bacterium]|nr:PQQ-binding-like beta-propeller repeat protein [Planctomycetota bacterium]